MPRTVILTNFQAASAAQHLRAITAPDATTPGLPAPNFGAVTRLGTVLATLLKYVAEYGRQQQRLQREHAMVDKTTGNAIEAVDANQRPTGGFRIADIARFNEAMADLNMKEIEVTIGHFTMDDLLDVARRPSVGMIADLMPLMDPAHMEVSAEAQARAEAYEAALAKRAPVAPPVANPGGAVPTTAPGA